MRRRTSGQDAGSSVDAQLREDQPPEDPPKRRKLKHPRVSKACALCRRRKVRCSGTQPCDYCNNEAVRCEYNDALPRSRLGMRLDQSQTNFNRNLSGDLPERADSPSAPTDHQLTSPPLNNRMPISNLSGRTTPRGSRRLSLDPPQTFAEGQHIGPTAGVSFLYHGWDGGEKQGDEGNLFLPSAALISYGDIPQAPIHQNQPPVPTREEATAWLDRYFRFATPTYRYHHRPTLERWMSQLLDKDVLPAPQAAAVFLACAQALLYTTDGDRYRNGGDKELNRSRFSKTLLNQEPGPPTVASVQARLAMCLYLLSTFRINECRYVFSLACAILTALGLHRKTGLTHKIGLLTSESQKRTFWCAYILDGYLSVMLGRPRILRDDDIDQGYPLNIDDQDLLSSESAEDLPLHGNLEAFVAHADLAKLMAHNSDLLYPLKPLSEDEVFERTNLMLEELRKWRAKLPEFLKPKDRTMTGPRTFERQNTVLKLAGAHLQILITRRCLLTDFRRLGRRGPSPNDDRATVPIQDCAGAIRTILNATIELVERGALYQALWYTQYISLVAISTLYVFIIQMARLPLPETTLPDSDILLQKAQILQDQLAKIAPDGSPMSRHLVRLSHLREQARQDAARVKRSGHSPSRNGDTLRLPVPPALFDEATNHSLTQPQATPSSLSGEGHFDGDRDQNPVNLVGPGESPNLFMDFTPSQEDAVFHPLLPWGWENLDMLGFPPEGEGYNFQQ